MTEPAAETVSAAGESPSERAVLHRDLTYAVEALNYLDDPTALRNALRAASSAILAWQGTTDPVGMVQHISNVHQMRRFVRDRLDEFVHNDPADPRISKIVSALLSAPPERVTPDLVAYILRLFSALDISPSTWQLEMMAAGLISHLAAQLPDTPHKKVARAKRRTVEAATNPRAAEGGANTEAVKDSLYDDDGDGMLAPEPSLRELTINVVDLVVERDEAIAITGRHLSRIVSVVLLYESVDATQQLLRLAGPIMRGSQLNPTLASLAFAGALEPLATLLKNEMRHTPLNHIIGNAIINRLLQANQFEEVEDSFGPLVELVSLLLRHPHEPSGFGILQPSELERLCEVLITKAPHAVCQLVRTAASAQRQGKRPVVTRRLLALGMTAAVSAQAGIGLVQEIAGLAVEKELGAPGLSLKLLGAAVTSASMEQAVAAIQVVLLGAKSLNEGIVPVGDGTLMADSDSADELFTRRLPQMAREYGEFGQLSRAIDIGLAANALRRDTVIASLLTFPPADPEHVAGQRLRDDPGSDLLIGASLADHVAGARSEALLAAGQLDRAHTILSRTAIGPESLPARLRVLSLMKEMRRNDIVAFLHDLCVTGTQPLSSLGLTGNEQRTTPEALAAEQILQAASHACARARNNDALQRITRDLGLAPVPHRPSTKETDHDASQPERFDADMPVWLIEAWLAASGAGRENARATLLLTATYENALNMAKIELADKKPGHTRPNRGQQQNASREPLNLDGPASRRLPHLAALLCERLARQGRTTTQIKGIINQTLSVADLSQRTPLAGMYEQLLVATKKPERKKRFAEEVSPNLERHGIPVTAGIWTTVALGAFVDGVAEGEAQLLQALEQLHKATGLAEADEFFSVGETAALTSVYGRQLKDAELDKVSEQLQGLGVDGPAAFAMMLRAVGNAHAQLGDDEAVTRVLRLAVAASRCVPRAQQKPLAELKLYLPAVLIVALAARAGMVPWEAVASQIADIFESCARGRFIIRSVRAVDALAELVLAHTTHGGDAASVAGVLEAGLVAVPDEQQRVRLLMRAGMLAADQLPVGSPLHHAVRAVANVHQIPLPARLLDAFDAATMEQARNTISSMVEPTDVEDEVALTAGQFTVMSALLGHELQAPLRKLSALSMEFGYYLSLAESGPLPVPAAELRQWSSDVALCQKQVEVLANQFISDKGRKGERAVDSVRRLVSRIGAGITFHDHTPPDARLRTTANRTTLSLVLNTLCSNAVAAAGGEPVSVTCSILPPAASDVGNTAGWFAIAIANGGAPMPDAVVQGINEGRWAGDPALGGVGAPLADINVRRAGGWMRWTPRGDGAGNLVTVAFPLSE